MSRFVGLDNFAFRTPLVWRLCTKKAALQLAAPNGQAKSDVVIRRQRTCSSFGMLDDIKVLRDTLPTLPPGCEFLHFLPILAGLADTRQAIESTPLSTFLHFMHFLQPSRRTALLGLTVLAQEPGDQADGARDVAWRRRRRARTRCRMNNAKNGRRREAAARPNITEVLYFVNNCGAGRQLP